MLKKTHLAAALGLSLLAGGAAQAQVIKIDGSSTVYPITEAVAEEFQKAKKNAIKVTVGISGTGGGFKKFCRGETDSRMPRARSPPRKWKTAGRRRRVHRDAGRLRCTDRGRQSEECLPQAGHRRGAEEAVGARRPGPDHQMEPGQPGLARCAGQALRRRRRLGTFEYFTEAIVGKAKSSRGDYTASEDDNVLVQGVSRDVNAIGYFGYAYYAENTGKLKALPIVSPKTGKAVEPSAANVENGSYQPLSRPIFVYVKAKSLEKPEVKEFIDFYMKNGAKLTKEVKYVPLPAAAYTGNLDHVARKKLGTVFGGKNEVGITIEELMKREAKM